jgi:DNA-binding NarL/FixJ family response regulator
LCNRNQNNKCPLATPAAAAQPDRRMKLLLVDDHALFREALRALLGKVSPEVTVYEAASVHAAIDECRNTAFRMVLLDLGLSESHGIQTLNQFRAEAPEVPVVVLSGEQDAALIRDVIECGAAGYIPKSHTSDQMISALRFVVAGGIYLPPELLQHSDRVGGLSPSETGRFRMLSPRQQQVARLLLQGQANKAIARELALSEGTVKAHVSAIYQIIGARNRVEAVTLAAKHGFIVM